MNFYAYLWLREDGSPYYVGKGKGDRAFHVSGHTVKPPKDRSRIIIFPRASEKEAFDTEIELIRNWGRKDIKTGCLRNRTNGGDGASGHIWYEDTYKKFREATRGRTPWNKGKRGVQVVSLDTRKKQSDLRKGKPFSDTHRKNISLGLTGRDITWGDKIAAAKQRSKKEDKLAGNHIRWHLNRGTTNPKCGLCVTAV